MWFDVSRRRFSIEQIEAALRQAQAGTPEAVLVRRLGISALTFERWKKRYGGLPAARHLAERAPQRGIDTITGGFLSSMRRPAIGIPAARPRLPRSK
ncbi:MAG: transposase [Burkholderiaceae bacterium]|jgi:hypothetical protein|nr:transposase [Burkholderiaceae bacterium]